MAHRVTWFAPDRPVDGGTVFVRPAPQFGEDRVAVPPPIGDDD